jgi:predicted ATP-grasp superfamily ATP-dependent carboligase
MTRVLVCDGEQRTALAAVRSLGRAGCHVDVCSHDPRALAAASRHVRRFRTVPDPLTDPAGFAEAVIALAGALASDVVLPVTDQSSSALLPARDRFAGSVIAGPSAEAFRAVTDKRRVLELAREEGIATPQQFVIEAPSAARPASVPFPVVVKPAASVRGGRRWSVAHAADAPALEGALAKLTPDAFPVLVQQRIVGPGTGVFLLVWEGRTVATFAHRRVREFPLSGGASTYCVSIPADLDLVARSRALLDRAGFSGAAMVEYKVDTASGTACLMEVNGRLWGSLQLAVDAGVDFPRLLVDAALGRVPAPVTAYRVGAGLRSWWEDAYGLAQRLRHGPDVLGLPPGAPGRLAALAAFLRWRRLDRNEVLRLDDPRPFWRQSLAWLSRR